MRVVSRAHRTLVVTAALLATVSCGGPAPPPRRLHADVKQLMAAVIDPAADVVWESVGTIDDVTGTEEIHPWTTEEWDVLARLRRQRNLALADAQVGPERATAEQVRAAGGLEDMPLIVLTQGRGLGGWSDLQRQLAERSRRGRQVMVPDSGHRMPMEAPGAIVSAVRELVTSDGHGPTRR